MANYGKYFTIIGFVIVTLGIILLSTIHVPSYETNWTGIIPIIIGVVCLMIGLPRWVQGDTPLILGKIVRPKSAARSAWMWSIFIFNLTPFYLPNNRILYYGPPFPFFIVTPSSNGGSSMPYFLRPNSGYMWMPYIMGAFFIVWILGLFLVGKYPNFFRILLILLIRSF
jgi:hypothetical protein